jgi:hypothetical protein
MKLYNSKEYLLEQIKTKTYPQIARENNVSKYTIYRKFKKFNLTKPASKEWTIHELNILRDGYSTNRDFFDKLKNRSLSSIYHKSSRLNIPRYVKPLRYKIDENFLNVWTKELAYFLGFFMADGYINSKKWSFSIKIQKRDGYILNRFLRLIKTNSPIREKDNYSALIITNRLISKKLTEFGCKPGDSLNNSYPYKMPAKYFFHFLRGYIDGDGSIFICKSEKCGQKNVLRVTIFGSKEFLRILTKKISYYLNKEISYKIIKSGNNSEVLYRITFNGELARILCYKLYKDCSNLYIKRKREKFNIHLKQLFKNA